MVTTVNNNPEVAQNQRRNIVDELQSYGHYHSLWYVNRDGDKYFIECPNCHTTDLNAIRLFGCKSCHTRFTVNPEDGVSRQEVVTELLPIRSPRESIKIVGNSRDAYFKQILYPRNYDKVDEIKEQWPDACVQILAPDLQKNGKDAHSHDFYKQYVVIPL